MVATLVPVELVELVGDDVFVPLGVVVDVGVWVADEDGVASALAVIDGEAPDERLDVDVIVIEPEIVGDALGVADGVFVDVRVVAAVILALCVVDGVSPIVGETVPDCEAESPEESVVVGLLVGEELNDIDVDGV